MDHNNATQSKTARNRSRAYPSLSLPECIRLAQKLFDGLGQGPYERKTLARGLGYSSFSGAVSAKIGSLVQFGLLERFHGGYSITAGAREIFTYPDETSQPAILEGALRPPLYKKLIDNFTDKTMPRELPAVLAANYGITEKAAPEAAANFVATMEFAGLLKDGFLGSPRLPEAANRPAAAISKVLNENDTKGGENDNRIKIELPCGGAVLLPQAMAYRISLGEFAQEIKNLDRKAGGITPE